MLLNRARRTNSMDRTASTWRSRPRRRAACVVCAGEDPERRRLEPQVVSLEDGTGTDKLAGERARLFLTGSSSHYLEFSGSHRSRQSSVGRNVGAFRALVFCSNA
jgi:hypothetical protein